MTKKAILITGAGSGFGKAAAIGMAKNGHNVIATMHVHARRGQDAGPGQSPRRAA